MAANSSISTFTSSLSAPLSELDPDVATAVDAELHRQQSTLEMIASENFAPAAVMEAQGSVLTNKYAEGYPGRRYYGGCEHVDVVERLRSSPPRSPSIPHLPHVNGGAA